MLVGSVGVFGVDGSSEVDGDNMEGWERSSARTTAAGVPLVMDGTRPCIWSGKDPGTCLEEVADQSSRKRGLFVEGSADSQRRLTTEQQHGQSEGRWIFSNILSKGRSTVVADLVILPDMQWWRAAVDCEVHGR